MINKAREMGGIPGSMGSLLLFAGPVMIAWSLEGCGVLGIIGAVLLGLGLMVVYFKVQKILELVKRQSETKNQMPHTEGGGSLWIEEI